MKIENSDNIKENIPAELVASIEAVISKAPGKEDLGHARIALKWLLKLKPDADLAAQIAVLAHDIERGTEGYLERKKQKLKKKDYEEYKRIHAEEGATVVAEILKDQGYDQELIDRVKGLVTKHETGGDPDSDLLQAADSLSYFENNVPGYLKRGGPDQLRKKMKFMFGRSSEKTKELIRQFSYKDEEVQNIFKEVVL